MCFHVFTLLGLKINLTTNLWVLECRKGVFLIIAASVKEYLLQLLVSYLKYNGKISGIGIWF